MAPTAIDSGESSNPSDTPAGNPEYDIAAAVGAAAIRPAIAVQMLVTARRRERRACFHSALAAIAPPAMNSDTNAGARVTKNHTVLGGTFPSWACSSASARHEGDRP
jgi:hypothetical protein